MEFGRALDSAICKSLNLRVAMIQGAPLALPTKRTLRSSSLGSASVLGNESLTPPVTSSIVSSAASPVCHSEPESPSDELPRRGGRGELVEVLGVCLASSRGSKAQGDGPERVRGRELSRLGGSVRQESRGTGGPNSASRSMSGRSCEGM